MPIFNNTASINGGDAETTTDTAIPNTANSFGGALYVNGTNSSVSVTSTTFN